MSMDTISPTTKDEDDKDLLRKNYLRSHRSQDHGDANARKGQEAKTRRINWGRSEEVLNLTADDIEKDWAAEREARSLGRRARLQTESHLQSQEEIDAKLRKLSPAQLETEATRLLKQDHGDDDGDAGGYMTNAEREAEVYDEDEIVKDTIQAFHDEISDLKYNRERGYGSLGIIMGKRKRGDAERQYQGTTGDDDDPRGDVTRGFTFTNRP